MNKRLREYIADPENEDNIHNIRVAIRRLDVMFSLLSKKHRKQHRNKIDRYKQLLTANSKARDCDIIARRLLALGFSDTSELKDRKKKEVARAVILVRSLEEFPFIDGDFSEKRSDKMVCQLVDKIEDILPLVLSDSSKIEELHLVRRDLRKLRYVLEVVSPHSQKQYMKKLKKATGKNLHLKKVQDLLGSIHDCDITIEYLRERPNEVRLPGKEEGNRKKLYGKFVRRMTK